MKKIFAMILAVALLLALAGCGEGKSILAMAKKEIAVTTLEEFLDAIGSGKNVRLDAEILLSRAVESEGDFGYAPPDPGNKALRWERAFDGFELVVSGVRNLTIRCGPKGGLVTAPRYSFVLNFEDCRGITLEGLTAGHTVGGTCEGGVLRFADCKDITIKDCDLYGCGTEGLLLENVDGLAMEGGSIYECTYDIMTALDSKNLTFRGCAFRDNGEYNLVGLADAVGVLFEDCLFEGNRGDVFFGGTWWGDGGCEDVTVNNCTFRGNVAGVFCDADAINFEDCVFEDNRFDGDEGEWEYKMRVIDFDYAWATREGTQDRPGKHLAAVGYAGGPESLTLAVGTGQPFAVKYEGEKKATGDNGEYWEVYEGVTGPYWSTAEKLTRYEYLLLPASREGGLLKMTPAKAKNNKFDDVASGFEYNHGHPAASKADVATMEAYKGGRKVLHSELLATDETGGRVALFQYENTDEGLLILAYINGERLITEELTAYIYEDEDGQAGPYWRADMEENDISEFEVAMLCETDAGLILAYWWYGAEGTIRSLMVEDGGEFVNVSPTSGAWYYDHWDDTFYQAS